MRFSCLEWHQRFTQQATWTHDLRTYLYAKSDLKNARLILDAGCGTGALLQELKAYKTARVVGIDLLYDNLRYAETIAPDIQFAQADLHQLPFSDGFFDICLLHYVLMWVDHPTHCLTELRRVTRQGGRILAMAEPDYGGRIDFPDELAVLGKWQKDSLIHQGADPEIGRKLKNLFIRAGLAEVECGVMGGHWVPDSDLTDRWSEWTMIEHDMQYLEKHPDPEYIEKLRTLEDLAYQKRSRILFVPTFYAIGKIT
jgi:SAM-dependent methyltransferase